MNPSNLSLGWTKYITKKIWHNVTSCSFSLLFSQLVWLFLFVSVHLVSFLKSFWINACFLIPAGRDSRVVCLDSTSAWVGLYVTDKYKSSSSYGRCVHCLLTAGSVLSKGKHDSQLTHLGFNDRITGSVSSVFYSPTARTVCQQGTCSYF